MNKIYISGKITGLSPDTCERLFSEAENRLKGFGFEPVNPLKNGLPETSTWEQHMGRDIELLLGCSAIYLLDNWINSKGAKVELAVAMQCGLIIFNESHFKK